MKAIDALFTNLQRNEAEHPFEQAQARHRILVGVTHP